MNRRGKLVICIVAVTVIWIALVIGGTFFGGADLTQADKNILVLAGDKYEQPNGAVDMAFMIHLENGSIKNYTPIYPGGKVHPSVAAPSNIGGNLRMHDCLWFGTDVGMDYAKEIVASETGMQTDAVVIVYSDAMDAIIDSIRPLKVDGQVTDLNAEDIVRENDAYNGYSGSESATGTMSRGDAVMVLVRALSETAKDPNKKNAMIQTALDQYNKGNILMKPQGSFARLLATKGLDSIT
ncbi:DUF4012 domain-containing protein [uncultured Methanobrevibacter sp.]|uniref:DUF4012 domain-containing protein n=1 Tax=uncultured Methanobrevibacter sp. TaxID=253161 RepID=UPI0025EA0A26|nr:DUF4012 domain-containing protein [uncultured Methanobrevibacter sp.]